MTVTQRQERQGKRQGIARLGKTLQGKARHNGKVRQGKDEVEYIGTMTRLF